MMKESRKIRNPSSRGRNKMMSVEFWNNAEKFYEFWVIVLGIAAFVSLIVLLFIWMYAKKEKRKSGSLLSLGVIGILIGVGTAGHLRYQPYLEQAGRVNPLIRDRQPTMAGYVYYGKYEQNYFSQLNDLDSLREMELYEEQRVTEPITYLGSGQYFHYFEREDGVIFKQNRQVEFTEDTDQTQLVGSRFYLKDEAFQEIGFRNPDNVMFGCIEVPASEEGKAYEPEYDPDIPTTEERFHEWNF